MKKLLFFLAIWLTSSNVLAVVPEDGVYIVVPEGWDMLPSLKEGYPDNIDRRPLPYWNEERIEQGVYGGEPALLVIADGVIIRANGVVYVDFFFPSSPIMPHTDPRFPQMHFDLKQIEFSKQDEGSFTLSLNVDTTDSGIPAIRAGRFFALHGVLNFDTPTAGKCTLTAAIAFLTENLQAKSHTIENTMYVIKL